MADSLIKQCFKKIGSQLDRIIAGLQGKDLAKTYVYRSDGTIDEYNIVGTLDGFPGIGIFENQFIVKVEIGNTVTNIFRDTFYNCISLTSLTIPDSVVSMVGGDVFEDCPTQLFDTTTIPGVKLVDGWAVGYTNFLTGDVNLTGVRGIGSSAFENCQEITDVIIPNNISNIDEQAFYNCVNLGTVTIGDGVTSIGQYAFEGCSGLTSVAIPDGVTSIGDDAFYDTSIMNTYITTKTAEQVQAMDYYPWGLPVGGTVHCSDTDLVVPESGGSGS